MDVDKDAPPAAASASSTAPKSSAGVASPTSTSGPGTSGAATASPSPGPSHDQEVKLGDEDTDVDDIASEQGDLEDNEMELGDGADSVIGVPSQSFNSITTGSLDPGNDGNLKRKSKSRSKQPRHAGKPKTGQLLIDQEVVDRWNHEIGDIFASTVPQLPGATTVTNSNR